MKKSQLKQIIEEEMHKVLTELQPSVLKRINNYIDNTHHTESNSFLDDFNIPGHVPFNPIYQLRDMVDNFLDSPEGSEAEEVFRDTLVWHLETSGEGFTKQQIEEYMRLLKLRRDREQIGGVKLSETHVVKKSQLKQIIKEELIKILKENEYLDQLLDKISSSGMDSLSPKEKTYLDQYSKEANPKSLSPENFKVRLEKNEFGVYDSYLYTQDNSWIPQQVFDIGNSIYMGEPDDLTRIPVYLNTYPKPDPESNMTDFKDAKTNDPNGAIIFSDKEGKMLNILKDVGNLDDLTPTNFGTSKIKIPGKYVEILKF
jgi:hypothetical protein